MRVIHVVTAYPRSGDDVITPWMAELIGRSRARGVDAEVLAPAYRGSGDEEIRGVPVRRFRYAPARWERLTHEETVPDRLRRMPRYRALLPLYLAGGVAAGWRSGRGGPEVVHVHWPMPHALFGAAARAASGGRSALVCSFYAAEVNWVERRLRWLRPFLRWTARTADEVTAISTSTARAVRSLSGRDPTVVPFSGAVGRESRTPDPERSAASLSEDPLRILFVGRLVERKGVEHLVRAVERVSIRRPVELTVVGRGPREAAIRDAARRSGLEDRVRLTGYVPVDELSRLYRECDIFVLPAVVDRKGDTEGLGVVLLEALRFERPVIASDIGGIPDIVKHARTGWLVPPGDAVALADRILAVAADPAESRRVARRGREFAAERFSWDRILDDLFEVYRRAILGRRPTGGGGSRVITAGDRET